MLREKVSSWPSSLSVIIAERSIKITAIKKALEAYRFDIKYSVIAQIDKSTSGLTALGMVWWTAAPMSSLGHKRINRPPT
jgi:hypothetical protein